jgi:hypothetical protein
LGYDEIHTMSSLSRSGIWQAADEDCRAITLEGWEDNQEVVQDAAKLQVAGIDTSTSSLETANKAVMAAPLGAVGSHGL